MLNNDAEETGVPEGAAQAYGYHQDCTQPSRTRPIQSCQAQTAGIKSGLMRQMLSILVRVCNPRLRRATQKDLVKGRVIQRSTASFFVTDRDGNQICYRFSKGQPGACSEPCPDERSHCCQLCLGQHPKLFMPFTREGQWQRWQEIQVTVRARR